MRLIITLASVISSLTYYNLFALVVIFSPLIPKVWRTSSPSYSALYQQLTKDDIACVLKSIAAQEKNISSESTDAKSTSPAHTDKGNFAVSRARGFFPADARTPALNDIPANMQEESVLRQRHVSAP